MNFVNGDGNLLGKHFSGDKENTVNHGTYERVLDKIGLSRIMILVEEGKIINMLLQKLGAHDLLRESSCRTSAGHFADLKGADPGTGVKVVWKSQYRTAYRRDLYRMF